jgi:chitinase
LPESVSRSVWWPSALALLCALASVACAAGGAAGVAGGGVGDSAGAAGSGQALGAAGGSVDVGAGAGGGPASPGVAGTGDAGEPPDAAGPIHIVDAAGAGAEARPDRGPDATLPATRGPLLVGYLPNYNGSFASWAKKLDFAKMTHLNLAFALASSSNQWSLGAPDADVKAIVDAAHAAGVKVLASLGGGGGDQTVIARYKDAASVTPLVDNLDAVLAARNLDGADIDIESPENLGKAFSTFVDRVVAKLRPEGKLVTAAVAQYLQDSMADATLHEFDFVNVMIYSSLADTMRGASYYVSTKKVPRDLVVLGAGFFGDGGDDAYTYAQIVKADPTAWSKDQATVGGSTVRYEGTATMRQIADYAKGFGGVMIWELTQDTFDDHSLLKVIQGEL